MISCPKCQFRQPKDRFCAQCGVEMDHYEPSADRRGGRTFNRYLLPLLIVSALISAGLMFRSVVKRQSKMTAQLMPSVEGLEDIPSWEAAGAEKIDRLKSAQNENESAQPANEEQASPPEVAAVPETAAEEKPRAPASADSKKPTVFELSEVNAQFLEVPVQWLNQQLSSAGQVQNAGAVTVGVLKESPEIKRVLEEKLFQRGARALPFRALKQPLTFRQSRRDTQLGREIGIGLDILPVALTEKTVAIEVDAFRSFRAAQSPGRNAAAAPREIEEDSDRFSFTLATDQIAFIAGLIPHRNSTPGDEELLAADPILSVLFSPDFISGETEFIILLTPKSSGAKLSAAPSSSPAPDPLASPAPAAESP